MSRINIVEEGADPSGSDPIDDVLGRIASPNTEIVFPEGRYRLGSFATDHDRLQFRGDNATLVPTNRGSMSNWFELHSSGFVMDGFEWDMRECDYPPRFHLWGDNWLVQNVVVRGHVGTNGKDMDIHGVSFLRGWVTAEDGTGVWRNVYLGEGSGPPGARTNRRAFLIEGKEQRGHMVFDRVWLEQWGENTLYANNHPGRMTVKNCFFRNTNVGVRVGGNTTVKNCTFVRNYDVPLQKQGWSGGANMRGIRVEGDDEDAYPGELVVRDCDFVFYKPGLKRSGDWSDYPDADPWASRPPIRWKAPVESTRIENCRLRYDGYNGYPIHVRDSDGGSNGRKQQSLEIEGVHVDHRGYEGHGAIGIDCDPGTVGKLSGVVSTPGKPCSATRIETDLREGSPERATSDPPMGSPPPLGKAPSPDERRDSRLLVVDASDGRTEYTLKVSGDLWRTPEWGASVGLGSEIDGSKVQTTTGRIAAYRFTGDVRVARFDGDATLHLAEDGSSQEVTPKELLREHRRAEASNSNESDGGSDGSVMSLLKSLYAALYGYVLRPFK